MILRRLQRLFEPAAGAGRQNLIPLAAAALLIEVSWADQQISVAELDVIRGALRRTFELNAAEVENLLELARQDHANSVGVYDYTRAINESWDDAAKFDLLVALWQLAFSDDRLSSYEEHAIRRIAELLYVDHDRFIAAKLRAKRNG